ncbi:MAG: cytoplasmic protein [Alteromonadaceae bacterium]|nr:cytoplasmic protein [Alteromonadaceae bacterium]
MTDRIDKVRTRYFNEFAYPQKSFRAEYLAEISNFDIANWDAPKRAARLSAAVKNYKTSEMLVFLLSLPDIEEIDLTPTVVKKLFKNWFNRTGSQKGIVALFGVKGRIKKSENSSEQFIIKYADKHRRSADRHWQKCLNSIDIIKKEYRSAVDSK